MPGLIDMLPGAVSVASHRPWPRVVVSEAAWRLAAGQLAAGEATLLGLWGDGDTVHMAMLAEPTGEIAVVSYECPGRTFPSVSALHPPAMRLERAVRSLFGFCGRDVRTLPEPLDSRTEVDRQHNHLRWQKQMKMPRA